MPENQVHEFKAERKTVGVVLIANFNPLMFHPEWFQKHGIINSDEVDDVLKRKNEMICAPGFTSFYTSQLLVRVEDQRFEVTALKEPFVAALDACKKVFEGLETLTIMAMGINTMAHFRMPDVSTYHKFGDILAPKDRWKAFLGPYVSGDDRKGGLLSLSMSTLKPDGKGKKTIKVERSSMFSFPSVGIFLNSNNHFSFQSADSSSGIDANDAMEILSANFESSLMEVEVFQQELFKDL